MDKQIIIDNYFRKIVDINGKIVDYEIKNSEVSKLVQKIEKYNSYIERKEQECKDLREDIKDIANLLDLDTGEEYNFGNIELEIKQLKAKEQENERLVNKNNRLKEKLNATKLLLEGKNNQYSAKMQECEKLKRQHQGDKGLITSTGKMNYQLIQEYDKMKTDKTEALKQFEFVRTLNTVQEAEIRKLKQTLAEIKELCKRQDLNQGSRCIQILQKISEVQK